MGGENDDILTFKVIFRFGKVLVGDNFTEGLVGGVGLRSKERHGLIELLSEGGFGVILGCGGWQVG